MARKPKQTSEITNAESASASASTQTIASAELKNQEAAELANRSRCGGALRTAREKMGLSTHEIANRLRLSQKQIEALEADNFAALPEATIVKGFIRNYAKQLKIDAEPLLDAYNVIVPSKSLQSFTLRPSHDVKVNAHRKPNLWRNAVFGLFALLGVGVWLFYQHYVQKPSPVMPSAELTQPATNNQPEPMPEAALPAAERAPDQTAAQEITLPNAQPASLDTAAAASPASATAPETPAPITPPAASVPPVANAAMQPSALDKNLTQPMPAEPPAGMTKVEFVASQETWINVVDSAGREIYSKTLFEGNRESLNVKPPVNVTVGNSGGTNMNVNGKAVDLAPHTRTNVAHIKVD